VTSLHVSRYILYIEFMELFPCGQHVGIGYGSAGVANGMYLIDAGVTDNLVVALEHVGESFFEVGPQRAAIAVAAPFDSGVVKGSAETCLFEPVQLRRQTTFLFADTLKYGGAHDFLVPVVRNAGVGKKIVVFLVSDPEEVGVIPKKCG